MILQERQAASGGGEVGCVKRLRLQQMVCWADWEAVGAVAPLAGARSREENGWRPGGDNSALSPAKLSRDAAGRNGQGVAAGKRLHRLTTRFFMCQHVRAGGQTATYGREGSKYGVRGRRGRDAAIFLIESTRVRLILWARPASKIRLLGMLSSMKYM